MGLRTPRTRYRAAIITLAGVALAAGMAGVGLIAAEASPHASPSAVPAATCPIPISIPGVCDSAAPTATSTATSTSTSGSSCPLPIPIPGLCDSTSPTATTTSSASPTSTSSATQSATATATPTSTVSATLSATPTRTTSHSPTPTPTPTSTQGSAEHKPLAGYSHESATGSHPTRVVITLVARGSKITKLTHVKLQHCTWSLGSTGNKQFKGGKRKVRIVVNRSSESTPGSVTFWAFDAAHQHRVVKARV